MRLKYLAMHSMQGQSLKALPYSANQSNDPILEFRGQPTPPPPKKKKKTTGTNTQVSVRICSLLRNICASQMLNSVTFWVRTRPIFLEGPAPTIIQLKGTRKGNGGSIWGTDGPIRRTQGVLVSARAEALRKALSL